MTSYNAPQGPSEPFSGTETANVTSTMGESAEWLSDAPIDILFKAHLEKALAKYAHDAWAAWMHYLFTKCTLNDDGTATMPDWAVLRWQRQMNTAYALLSEQEQESDKQEARRMIAIIEQQVAAME